MAIQAYGNVALFRGNGATPEVFTRVASISGFQGVETTNSYTESTNFDSAGGYREFIPGLRDPGSMTLTLQYDPADTGFQALEADHEANVLRNFRKVYGQGAERRVQAFSAYIETISQSEEVDGLLEASVTLRISGPVVRGAPITNPTIMLDAPEGGNLVKGLIEEFVATLSAPVAVDVLVAVTAAGTAVPGTDYAALPSAPLRIPAGQTALAIPVSVLPGATTGRTVQLTIAATLANSPLGATEGGALTRTATVD